MNRYLKTIGLHCGAMGVVLVAAVAAPQPVRAAPKTPPSNAPLDDPNAWPPPMLVGIRYPLHLNRPRLTWSRIAAYAKSKGSAKVAQDPLFQPASADVTAAFADVRKTLLAAKPGSAAQTAAESKLVTMLHDSDALAVARLAFADTNVSVLRPALRGAVALMAREPRLVGFVTQHLKNADADVVLAAATLVFAAGCEEPLEYALDALERKDTTIQTGILHLAYRAGLDHPNSPFVSRLPEWLAAGDGTTATRVLALRILGLLSWGPGIATVTQLTHDTDPAVAGEALMAMALITGGAPPATVKAFLADASPLRRAGAIRAVTQAEAMHPERIIAQVTPLLGDTAAVLDPVAPSRNKPPTVADLARLALDYAAIR